MKGPLCIIVALAIITLSSYGQNTYYVSPTGLDTRDGRSAANAWKTVSKVNSTTLSPGSKVLFEAGGVWREELAIQQGSSSARITYGRYGTGVNPRILGSSQATNWTATGTANVWRSATSVLNPYGTHEWGYPGEVFFEIGNTVSWGIHKTYNSTFSNLTQEYDWTWNSNVLYVYAPSDPDERYTSVEASQRDLCAAITNDASSYITVNGVDFHYSRRAGYGNSNYPEAAGQTDVTIKNCNIGYIGVKGGQYAYGIEAFHSNFLVDSCTITDCGRRGISFNFYEEHTPTIPINNVVVRNSVFKRGQHTTSLDMAFIYDNAASIRNVYFYNNLVDDHEITMTGDDATSNQLYFEGQGTNIQDVYIYNNVFINSTARNILVSGGVGINIWYNTIFGHNANLNIQPYANVSFRNSNVGGLINIDFRNNILYNNLIPTNLDSHGILVDYETTTFSARDYNLHWQTQVIADRNFTGGWYGYFDITEWSEYRAQFPAWDAHSPVPADPKFTNTTNWDLTLTATSPAVGKAIPIGMVTTDKNGNARSNTAPSIGAYEYNPGTNAFPSVALTSPANGSTFNAPATVTITASASDADGSITLVEFYNGTTKLGEKAASPYSYTWSSVPVGTYSITAVATDNLGAKTTSDARTITVNSGTTNKAPTVSITSPANGSNYTAPATVTITASAADSDGSITLVEFYNGTTKLGQKATAPYSYTWNSIPVGTYSITAVATDNQSAKTTSSAILISVNSGTGNIPPTITITSPEDETVYAAPADIEITVQASDADGTINRVVFYSDGATIGTSTSAPFTYNWNDVDTGSYSITAIAYDNLNASTISLPIVVYVGQTGPGDESEFLLFPNPNNGTFRITMIIPLLDATNTVRVTTFDGSVVYEDTILMEETEKDFVIPRLSRGNYILYIISSKGVIGTKKFVIQ